MRRHGSKRGDRSRGPYLVVACWLAVLAIVAQTILFEFAMAAPETAAADDRTAAHAHHAGHDGADHAPEPAPDQPRHQHGGPDCPFCLARADHQAAALPAAVLPLPVARGWAAAPLRRARIRARRQPARFRARAPPRPTAMSVT